MEKKGAGREKEVGQERGGEPRRGGRQQMPEDSSLGRSPRWYVKVCASIPFCLH